MVDVKIRRFELHVHDSLESARFINTILTVIIDLRLKASAAVYTSGFQGHHLGEWRSLRPFEDL